MFIDSAYVVSEVMPDHLLITLPGSTLGWPRLYVFFFLLFVVITYTTSRTVRRMYQQEKTSEQLRAYVWRYRATGMIIAFFSIGVWSLLAYSSGSIELDRRTNLATMRAKMTAFLPAETASMPLSAVDEATLESPPNARRIRLVGNGGEDLAYPLWTSRAGQAEAVRAINRFLACSGCDIGGEAELSGCNAKGGVSLLRFADDKVAEDWSRDIRACRRNAGPADFSFGTGYGAAILIVAKNEASETVVIRGPRGAVTFNEKQCDLNVELRPANSQAASAGALEVGGRVDIVCKSEAARLTGAVYFEHCGR